MRYAQHENASHTLHVDLPVSAVSRYSWSGTTHTTCQGAGERAFLTIRIIREGPVSCRRRAASRGDIQPKRQGRRRVARYRRSQRGRRRNLVMNPIAGAAGQGDVDMIELLHESRANLEAPAPDDLCLEPGKLVSKKSWRPLSFAIDTSQAIAIQALLKAGAGTAGPDETGDNPLMAASCVAGRCRPYSCRRVGVDCSAVFGKRRWHRCDGDTLAQGTFHAEHLRRHGLPCTIQCCHNRTLRLDILPALCRNVREHSQFSHRPKNLPFNTLERAAYRCLFGCKPTLPDAIARVFPIRTRGCLVRPGRQKHVYRRKRAERGGIVKGRYTCVSKVC